jgi:DNA-binding MarR family transcriptional regulator
MPYLSTYSVIETYGWKMIVPDDDDPRMQMVHLLRAVAVKLDLVGAAFASEHRLHSTDLRALIHLLDGWRNGAVTTPGWLADQLKITSAATTALIDRLQRIGYVRRAHDLGDRRRVLIAVDDTAMELGQAFFGPLIAAMVEEMGKFDDAEMATVRRFLTSMSTVIESTGH